MNKIPLKHIVQINAQTLPETTDPSFEFCYVDIGSVGRGELTKEPVAMTFAEAPSRARLPIRNGDTIISTVRTYLRAVWPVQHLTGNLIASTGFAVLTPSSENLHSTYLGWLAQSDLLIEQIVARSIGVSYPAITAAEMGQVIVPLPSIRIQKHIASYLNRETTYIDVLIKSKQRVIDNLEERVRLVSHDLTTKDTHIVQLRRLIIKIKTGTTPTENGLSHLSDGAIPWYSPGDVGNRLSLLPAARTLKRDAISSSLVPSFPPDSTLIVGIGATAGRVAHLDHVGTGNQQMTCIVSGSSILPRFLSWQLFARSEEIRAAAPFATLPILNNEFIKSLYISVPDLSQQAEIVELLDQEAHRIDQLVAATTKQLVCLKERRQALITAAMTGTAVAA